MRRKEPTPHYNRDLALQYPSPTKWASSTRRGGKGTDGYVIRCEAVPRNGRLLRDVAGHVHRDGQAAIRLEGIHSPDLVRGKGFGLAGAAVDGAVVALACFHV